VQKGCRKGAENEAEEAITTRQLQVLELIKKNNKRSLVEKLKISATKKQ